MNEHKQILDLIDQHAEEEIGSNDFMWMLLEYPREAVEEVKDLIDADIYERYLVERWRLFQGYFPFGLHSALQYMDLADIAFKSFGLKRKKDE